MWIIMPYFACGNHSLFVINKPPLISVDKLSCVIHYNITMVFVYGVNLLKYNQNKPFGGAVWKISL